MNKPFNPEGFSLKIFKERYALTEDETWEEACRRVATQMASAESPEKYNLYLDQFYNELVTNRFVPGGRIWYGSGRPHPNLLNCFVLESQTDSKEGWGQLSNEMIVTSMTGGGCGTDFSDIRPEGAIINGHRGEAPGPLWAMKMLNYNGYIVKAAGGRRTALMFSLDITHPDIETFLDSKLVNKELENANISVRCRDVKGFIDAVQNNKDLELSWKGKYKKNISARALWKKIVSNSYYSAEPGFLNLDLAESENPVSYAIDLVTTNPCGEIWLSEHESCCLGHLVLPRFLKKSKDVDWKLLEASIRIGVRFLDNVLTVNTYPLEKMKLKAHSLRRIGLGVTGLADMLVELGFKYGSEEGNEFLDKLFRFISKMAYQVSAELADEKGAFPLCRPELHIKTGYVKKMPVRIKNMIAEKGIRNCALITIAPTGTTSILSGNCSSGIEPMFASAYIRNYWKGEELKQEFVFHPTFKKFLDNNKDVSSFIGATELSVRQHMEVQKIIQKHVDNAVSKTINIKEDYPLEDMEKIWLEYLPHLKGTTFYRENSRKLIDENGKELPPPLTALSLEEAKEAYKKESTHEEHVEEQQCKNGVCDL